jgi:6,7-dimethyl-8-ribityllumazine synthase
MSRTDDGPRPAPRLEHAAVRLAIVVSEFHRDLGERLLEGARSRLFDAGMDESRLDVHHVPGAFELPLAAQLLATRGRYAALIALGAVIRGETAHFDLVSHAAVMGLSRVSLDTRVPCTLGLLTCDTREQALARSGGSVGNAGADAADAAVVLANLRADVN